MLTSFKSFSEKQSDKKSTQKTSQSLSERKLIIEKELEPTLNEFVSNFFKEVVKLPALSMLQYSVNQNRFQDQLKLIIIEQIEKEVEQAPKKLEEVHNNFIEGRYDDIIFNDKPQVTEELNIIISNHNREFIQHLFTKCTSDENLHFWLEQPNVKLPKDTWALAVNLGNNIVVLRYLKENGFFENLSNEDKKGLLTRASRFEGEGLEYLKKEFSESASKLKI